MRVDSYVITCEHGGNEIPAPYRPLFAEWGAVLESHRGWDPGALVMASELAGALRAPLVASTVSRLVIDLNRSLGHRQLFSAATSGAPPEIRAQIVAQYYRPYREQVEQLVREAVSRSECLIHISSHSFTPELDGQVRGADVGLLYDPARPGEAALAARWKHRLAAAAPELRVRRNYPYAGKADGLTSYLRRHFDPGSYVGIELEVNQRLVLGAAQRWAALRRVLIDSLPGPGAT